MDFDIFKEKPHDINDLLELIVDKTKEFSGCERVILYLYDEADRVLFNRAGEGVDVMELMFKLGQGIPGQALDKHKTILIQDVTDDGHYDAKVDDVTDVGVKSMLVSPIIDSRKKKIGVLQLINKTGGAFNDRDVVFVESMCAQASIAIENTLMFKHLQELRDREAALAEQIKEQNEKLQDAYMKVEEENKEVLETSEKMGRNRMIAMVAGVLLFFGIIGATWWYTGTGGGEGAEVADMSDDAFADFDFDNFDFGGGGGGAGGTLSEDGKVYTVGTSELSNPITLSGNLEPASVYNVFAPFSGRILSKSFVIGEVVEEGSELMSISPEKVEFDYRNAKVAEITAKEEYEKVKNWETSKELTEARQAVIKAKDDVTTAQKLYDLGIISEDNLDSAKDTLLNKEQQLDGVEEKGDAKNVQIAQYKWENAALNEAELRKKLDMAVVKAKMEGVAMMPQVSNDSRSGKPALVEPGLVIDEGTVFLSIADVTRLKVLGRVDEGDITAVKQGQEVTVTGDAFAGVVLKGKVVYVSSEAKSGSRKPYFEIRVETEELTEEQRKVIRIGMSSTLSIVTYTNPDAIMVPFGVIKIESGGSFVYKITPGAAEPEKVQISTGVSTPGSIEVTSGLSDGDQLLVIN